MIDTTQAICNVSKLRLFNSAIRNRRIVYFSTFTGIFLIRKTFALKDIKECHPRHN